MTAQKLFVIMLLLLIVSGVLWFTFLYQPNAVQLKQYQIKLSEINDKLRSVKKAEGDIESMEQRLADVKSELDVIKSRFVDRKNLTQVTEVIKKSSAEYDLKITDFTPVLDSYFENEGNETVKALPIVITMEGRYLNIGRFLENWKNLKFYLIPKEVIIEKLNPESNILTATITTNLYTWND